MVMRITATALMLVGKDHECFRVDDVATNEHHQCLSFLRYYYAIVSIRHSVHRFPVREIIYCIEMNGELITTGLTRAHIPCNFNGGLPHRIIIQEEKITSIQSMRSHYVLV